MAYWLAILAYLSILCEFWLFWVCRNKSPTHDYGFDISVLSHFFHIPFQIWKNSTFLFQTNARCLLSFIDKNKNVINVITWTHWNSTDFYYSNQIFVKTRFEFLIHPRIHHSPYEIRMEKIKKKFFLKKMCSWYFSILWCEPCWVSLENWYFNLSVVIREIEWKLGFFFEK